MSVSIGNELPDEVLGLLGAGAGPERIGSIIGLVTVDENGFPHGALLSPGEILATSRSTIRLALYSEGTTLRNVADRSRLTLIVVEPETCCYVKGVARISERTIPPGPLQPFTAVLVDVDVDDVLLDSEAGASIEMGPRYRREVRPEEELAYWDRVHEVLREG